MKHHTSEPQPPLPQPPLTLTIDDITETRAHQTRLSMRWSSDPETTARLNRIIRLNPSSPIPWWRKLIRLLRSS